MNPNIQLELFRQTLAAIQVSVTENLDCKHPPDDGSDDLCDGDDCIRCYVLELTHAALDPLAGGNADD